MQLPTVTLLAIDVARPLETVEAMKRTLRHIQPGKSILLTDTTRWPQVASVAAPLGIEVRNHIQSNDSITFPGVKRRFFVDYELAVMTEPLNHMGDSTHVLYMESDAGVMNPAAWDPAWLEYDYIGAPWCRHGDPGWPPCDGITNAVGNSGFSLQSRRFCENLAVALQERKDDRSKFSCDRWMCRTIRPWMEERGVKYATVEVASRFSCEDRIYDGSFGFHGRGTARINNWRLP